MKSYPPSHACTRTWTRGYMRPRYGAPSARCLTSGLLVEHRGKSRASRNHRTGASADFAIASEAFSLPPDSSATRYFFPKDKPRLSLCPLKLRPRHENPKRQKAMTDRQNDSGDTQSKNSANPTRLRKFVTKAECATRYLEVALLGLHELIEISDVPPGPLELDTSRQNQ